MKLLITAVRNPRWFAACMRAGLNAVLGRHSFESFENELKLAARRYDVDYHRFQE
jgi:hypothetical protein